MKKRKLMLSVLLSASNDGFMYHSGFCRRAVFRRRKWAGIRRDYGNHSGKYSGNRRTSDRIRRNGNTGSRNA